MEVFIGQIQPFGFNFAPRGWAFCDGQLLPINQNQALFSLLGTTYGGDGRTSFALPDLRGRTPIHVGQEPGLPVYQLGRRGGTETTTLTTANLPAHNHTTSISVTSDEANSDEANGKVLGTAGTNVYASAATAGASYGPANTGATGGQQPLNNMQPSLCIYFCIALIGLFPSRN
jgi:microcystin-dependent protein